MEPLSEPPEPYASRAARLPAEWSEREKVQDLLMSYCGHCHGPDVCEPEDGCAGMNYIQDMGLLIEEGQVLPGDADGSPLVQDMSSGRMPPGDSPDAPPELIARVSDYIESLCAPDAGSCEADVPLGQ